MSKCSVSPGPGPPADTRLRAGTRGEVDSRERGRQAAVSWAGCARCPPGKRFFQHEIHWIKVKIGKTYISFKQSQFLERGNTMNNWAQAHNPALIFNAQKIFLNVLLSRRKSTNLIKKFFQKYSSWILFIKRMKFIVTLDHPTSHMAVRLNVSSRDSKWRTLYCNTRDGARSIEGEMTLHCL